VQQADGDAVIVSVSTDGRVTQWSTKKGLVPTPLMMLKRARPAPAPKSTSAASASTESKEGKDSSKDSNNSGTDALGATGTEGLLSRTASGLSVAFMPGDGAQYFVGTEDGFIARCSSSYSEQYLDVIHAHSGPVNRVRVSPFSPHALISCSSDWSVKLHDVATISATSHKASKALAYTSDAITDAVADVVWSPSISTRFASVTRDGHIALWDASTVQPMLDVVVHVDEAEWRAKLEKEVRATQSAA
jgi:WD40 repeat protein